MFISRNQLSISNECVRNTFISFQEAFKADFVYSS